MPGTSNEAVQATYYVSPAGSDTSPGTFDLPFQTIDYARSRVSKDIADSAGNMTGDIVINLRGGTYYLSETLNFGPEDSGTNGHNVIYQAYEYENEDKRERPVISGGKEIKDWSLFDKSRKIWQATVGTDLPDATTVCQW